MSGNPEFDKELEKRFGITKDMRSCKACGEELIECPFCHNCICPDGCEPEEEKK
jgi:hypothetical protein